MCGQLVHGSIATGIGTTVGPNIKRHQVKSSEGFAMRYKHHMLLSEWLQKGVI
jgi:hypothetical protein